MEGFEYFKKRRIEKGYSVKSFSVAAGIGSTALVCLENGSSSLTSTVAQRCSRMFTLLDISIPDFYDEFYHYKADVDEKIAEWLKDNPQNRDFIYVKTRTYSKIKQFQRRNNVSNDFMNEIFELYNDYFSIYGSLKKRGMEQLISEQDYKKYVCEIKYKITTFKNPIPSGNAGILADALYHSDYTLKDVSDICGFKPKTFSTYFNGNQDYGHMRILTLLKICYLLNIDFDKLF